MKNCMFIVLMLFGFNALADMHSGMSMDQMSDMVGSSEEVMAMDDSASGFTGSLSLRYKPVGFADDVDELTYRARIGWMGDVNDQVKWGVVLSTDTEQSFSSLNVRNIGFEQAYLSYNPVENLYVKVGKMGWMPDFHKAGVLMSEQIYQEGVKIKYRHELSEDNSIHAKIGAYRLTEGNGPLHDGTTLEGKLGVKFNVSDFHSKLYIMGVYDGLPKDSDDGNAVEAQTLAKVGLMVSNSEMAVPAGVFAHYLSNADDLGKFSYTAGVSVGKAGRANVTSVGDFGLAINYYDIDETNYRTSWLNEDYVAGAGSGVAVRAQYNVWENSSLALKYAYDLSEEESEEDSDVHNLVAELTFVF